MPELSSPIFSETDDANAAPPPNGFPEGMAFSGVNDSARAVMGAMKRFWGRIQGAYASTGSANAYVVTPAQALTAYVTGERYSFRANFTNTGTATLNLSALGAKAIKKMTAAGKADLASGDIQSGQPVTVEYDGTDMVMVTPAVMDTIQPGTISPYSGFRAPPGWLFAYGQAISRTTYAALYAALTEVQIGALTSASTSVTGLLDTSILGVGMKVEGTGIPAGATIATIVSATSITLSAAATATGMQSLRFFAHGNGDGLTTFNAPDMRGRVAAGRDNMGGTAASRLTSGISGVNGAQLGAAGGDQRMQSHSHGGRTGGSGAHYHISGYAGDAQNSARFGLTGGLAATTWFDTGSSSGGGTTGANTSTAGEHWHSIPADGAGVSQNVQPTIVLNYIIKT